MAKGLNEITKENGGGRSVFSALLRISGLNLIAPFYHLVADGAPAHVEALYPVFSEKEFRNHLDFLSGHCRFIGAEQLLELAKGGEWKGSNPPAFLSFDDGLAECHRVIAPILLEKGIPAAFFVNTALLDSDRIFYRYIVSAIVSALKTNKMNSAFESEIRQLFPAHPGLSFNLSAALMKLGEEGEDKVDKLQKYLNLNIKNTDVYMTSSQVKELAEKGFAIGSHGPDHRRLDLMDEAGQLRQISEGLNDCAGLFPQKLKLFSFPHHDYNIRTSLYNKIFSTGMADLTFGTSGLKSDVYPYSIQRLAMERPMKDIGNFLTREVTYYMIKKSVGRHKMKRNP